MVLALSCDDSASVSIGIFKPRPSYTTDHVVARLLTISKYLEGTGCAKSAVLKSLSNTGSGRVAVYAIWKRGPNDDSASNKYPKVDAFERSISSVAETVDVSWYELSCWACKDDIPFPELSKGEIVHLRGITGEPENQEVLSYSCLAILQAYFQKVEGLLSCAFYKSLDGRRITGLGLWQNVQAAYAFLCSPEGPPGECYWRSFGAKLRYGIYEVAYVTGEWE